MRRGGIIMMILKFNKEQKKRVQNREQHMEPSLIIYLNDEQCPSKVAAKEQPKTKSKIKLKRKDTETEKSENQSFVRDSTENI